MSGWTWPGFAAGAIVLGGCSGPLHQNAAMRPPPSAVFSDGKLFRWDHRAAEPSEASGATLGANATLDDYLAFAAANNRGLEAAFYRWRAAVERLPQVRALPDPMLSYGYFLEDFTARRGMEQHVFELSQTFPWFGKLRLREDAAAKEADAAASEFEAQRLMLFLEVRRAYYELYQLHRETEITRDNLDLLGQIEAIARSRYRVGAATHPDIVRAQVELGRMEDRVRELEQMRRPAVARLNASLNRPADAEVPPPTSVPAERLAGDSDQLLALVLNQSPRLRAMASELERARVESELARLDRYPDFMIGGMYALRGDDPALLRVGVNLPLWRDKYDAAEREAMFRRLSIAALRHDEQNRLAAELHESIFMHNDAQRRLELYSATLLPKAGESLQASLAAFQAGTAGFLDVLDAERTLLEFRLAEIRARTDRAVSLARLDALVGQPVPRVVDQSIPTGGSDRATHGGGTGDETQLQGGRP
jgi:outer membrane protein, heavy metal efflux system